MEYVESDEELQGVFDLLNQGHFSKGDPSLFKQLVDSLLSRDEYMLMADYRSYIECQDQVATMYRDQQQWTRMSILNVARIGLFSSDRSIRDYAEKIWGVKQVKIVVDEG